MQAPPYVTTMPVCHYCSQLHEAGMHETLICQHISVAFTMDSYMVSENCQKIKYDKQKCVVCLTVCRITQCKQLAMNYKS